MRRNAAAGLLNARAAITIGRPVASAPTIGIERTTEPAPLAGPTLLDTTAADEFCAGDIDPIDYLIPPIVPRGGMAMPYGSPKVGKTTFVAHAVAAMLDNSRRFLNGVQGLEGDVLWLDLEQPWRVSRRRFAEAGATSPRLHIYRGPAPQPADLLATIEELSIEVLVVDSLVKWLMLENENDNSEINRKLTPIQHALMERDVTSIVLAHAGKTEATGGRNLRGGSHLLSAVDVAIEMKAEGPLAEGRRRLCFTSREEIVPDMIVRLANGVYVSEGTAKAVAVNARADDIIRAIRVGHNRKETLAEQLGVTSKTLEGWIAPLLESGKVTADKAATRGAPLIYSVPVAGTSQNFSGTSEKQEGLL